MFNFLRKHILIISGAIVGSIAGYMYYKFVGCSSGTCMITSKPLNSTVYGAFMFALIFSLFKKEPEIIKEK